MRHRRRAVPHRLHLREGQPHPPGPRQERLHVLPPLRWRAVRIAARPGAWAPDPEQQELVTRVRAGTATEAEQARFHELHEARSRALLARDPDELYQATEVRTEVPSPARVHASVVCAACGEATMETRIRRLTGRELCPPCFEEALDRA